MANLKAQPIIRHGFPLLCGLAMFAWLQLSAKNKEFADEVITETSKVVWPTFRDVKGMTIAVTIMLIISGIIIAGFDLGAGNTGTFNEWKTANGLAENSIIKMPGEYRQQSETNTGDRLSFSGGVEYKPVDNLKLGADVIYTKRELDGSRLEQLEMRLDQKTVGITPLAEYGPKATGEVGTGKTTVLNALKDKNFFSLI